VDDIRSVEEVMDLKRMKEKDLIRRAQDGPYSARVLDELERRIIRDEKTIITLREQSRLRRAAVEKELKAREEKG
jgi:hypothetical protein